MSQGLTGGKLHFSSCPGVPGPVKGGRVGESLPPAGQVDKGWDEWWLLP